MQTYCQLLDEIIGQPKFGEDQEWISIESRKWNRRKHVSARRRLPLGLRKTYDLLVRFALTHSLGVWSGSLNLGYEDLAELVERGWIRQPGA